MFDYKAQLEELRSELDALQKQMKAELNKGSDPTKLCVSVRHTLKRLATRRGFVLEEYAPVSKEAYCNAVRTLVHVAIEDNAVDESVIEGNRKILEKVNQLFPEWDTVKWDGRVARDVMKTFTVEEFLSGLVLTDGVFHRDPDEDPQERANKLADKTQSIMELPDDFRQVAMKAIEVVVTELTKATTKEGK